MEDRDDGSLTALLRAWREGSPTGRDDAFERAYDELRAVARRILGHRAEDGSLRPTALVHEAWLRISADDAVARENRRAFFFAASRAMRDALVEAARRKARPKRGGGLRRVELDAIDAAVDAPPDALLDIDAALERLGEEDGRLRRLVELRFFAGLGVEEAAEALGVSLSTAERDWRFARAWLRRELRAADDLRP